ncbi:MAG: 4Fe-4S dicluster domain-containing protein [Dehalococcoidia bacterium]
MADKTKNRIIDKSKVTALLDKLAQACHLIAPVKANNVSFRRVESGSQATLDYINSVLPPKNAFFPQTETIFRFFRDDNRGFQIEPGGEADLEQILFGIRPCDARSLRLMDMVFNGQYKDSYYLNKRGKTTLIGLACFDPDETCFCPTFGIEPASGQDVDILFSDVGDRYLVEASTPKGMALLDRFAEFFSEPRGDEEQLREAKKAGLAGMKKLEVTAVAGKMTPLYGGEYWHSIGLKCLGCGICTYLCPTCHCFDIGDVNLDEGGERFRCWDSCMFPEFTLMASGENPRPDRKTRIQQRFFHKLNYFYERYGELACVGCGRCIRYCPVNIDIARIIDDVASGKAGND